MSPGARVPRGGRTRADRWARARFLGSWAAALALVVAVLPRAVSVSWHGVLPVLGSVHWPAALALVAVWLGGLWAHSFVLTAAAPSLTHRRALTLNLTGSAVANVVPLGGAAGVELNRRMMRAWGFDGRAFAGYTVLTNLWDVGSKLLLPVVAVVVLARAGEHVAVQVQTASLVAGLGFVLITAAAVLVLTSARGAVTLGRLLELALRRGLGLRGRRREVDLVSALLDVRSQCAGLVARGWLRMTLGMAGYVALQGVLLGMCLHLTGGTNPWPEVLAAFAVERALTIVPVTPGGVGIADLGLVGVLLTLGGDPVSVAAAAVLYRVFVFAVEIPVGSGALGAWLLGQRISVRRTAGTAARTTAYAPARRVAHVTDVFLPRLGGIETHVDDLARHQRGAGLAADVLTPVSSDRGGTGGTVDPAWVRRMTAAQARRAVTGYDVVHVHVSMFSPFGIGVARAAVRAGVPVLVTVHSMWSGAGGILRLAAWAGLRRWPVAWSAVSAAAATTFGRSLGGAPVAVLPNAIDVAAWRRPGPDAPGSPGSPGAPVTIVSVMRLMPRKRPLQLLGMFERVRRLTGRDDLRLVLVGDGPLRRRVERAVRRRGLGEHVRITGRLARHDVARELATASVYVAPAPQESFGIAALEARCAGLPVVASSRSGVGEFVHDRVDGILVDGDTEMVAALADLVSDAALREGITDHNRRVLPAFDWSDVLGRTIDLYRVAADAAGVRPAVAVVPALVAAEA
ncbi:MAG TPA: glycosyltransferase [Nocardioides sp.]|nr:glycosyltransferase [Nocardioides sp.]